MAVERLDPRSVGRDGAEADVPVGAHERGALSVHPRLPGVAAGMDDVYEFVPTAVQAINALAVADAEQKQVMPITG